MFLGVLRTGNIGGVILGVNLSEYIIGKYAFNYVALIIFALMAVSQVLSMKLPQIGENANFILSFFNIFDKKDAFLCLKCDFS